MNQDDPAVRRFVDLFAQARYWDAHEALEDVWREGGDDFYQGLILYASAFVHAQRSNRHGVQAQLRKAQAKLEPYRPAHLGFDVDAILAHAHQCRYILERTAADEDDEWAREVMPPPLPRTASAPGQADA